MEIRVAGAQIAVTCTGKGVKELLKDIDEARSFIAEKLVVAVPKPKKKVRRKKTVAKVVEPVVETVTKRIPKFSDPPSFTKGDL